MKSCDFLCLQETWLSSHNVSTLSDKQCCEFLTKYDECIINGINESLSFSVEEIEKATVSLNLNKTANCENFTAEHVIFAHPSVYVCLKVLLYLCIKHGYCPSIMRTGIIRPIIKYKSGDEKDVKNYRPIMIISVFDKILETCILNRFGCFLMFNDLQFGCKQEGGCNVSLFTLNTDVNHFVKNKTDVLLVNIDVTAAFKRINVFRLLTILFKRSLPVVLVRFLLSLFINTDCKMAWKGSCAFDIKSAVKQGRILSPIFFSLNVNELLEDILKAKLGCSIGGVNYSIIFCADDIILLSGSVVKMQSMLDMCMNFGLKNDITFNPKKSVFNVTNVRSQSLCYKFEIGSKRSL